MLCGTNGGKKKGAASPALSQRPYADWDCLPEHLHPLFAGHGREHPDVEEVPQCILTAPNGAVLSASIIATTLGESVSSQYSDSTFTPSGYSHSKRRVPPPGR